MATKEPTPEHSGLQPVPRPDIEMAPDYVVADPPEWAAFEFQTIEDGSINGSLTRFSKFVWHGEDYWLMGRMVWRNRLASGFGLVRASGGRRVYRTPILVHPEYRPVEFKLFRPESARRVQTRYFRFLGFEPSLSVDMEFVRAEHRRLVNLPHMFDREDEPPIIRPPFGHIV